MVRLKYHSEERVVSPYRVGEIIIAEDVILGSEPKP